MNDKPKFVFECQECGKCCERDVKVFLDDINDWMEHGLMYNVLHHLSIVGDFGSVSIQLEKQTKDERTVCALYDLEKSECILGDNKPISCRSFPLGYNGKNYIIVDLDCPGLGQGSMTVEKLTLMRETARAGYDSKQRTQRILPMLENLFIRKMTFESQKAMEGLTPEQREELENILKDKEK
jgi:Fe-S-cluster containining protein